MQYIIFAIGVIVSILIAVAANKQKFLKNKYVVAVISSLLIALVLEFAVFNFNSYDFSDYNVNKTYECNVQESKQANDAATNKLNANVLIKDINDVVKHISFDVKTNAPTVKVNITYKDKANMVARSFDEFVISPKVKKTLTVSPDFSGNVSELSINLKVDVGSTIEAAKVTLNQKPAFNFNINRMLIVFAFILLLYIFKYTHKKSYETGIEKKNKCVFKNKFRNAFIIFAFIQVLLVVGVADWFNYDLRPTVDTAWRDFYQETADALNEGHVDLNSLQYNKQYVDNIPKLEKLPNVYSYQTREGIPYKFDYALYKGKYYTYFGIVPTALVYLPVLKMTGNVLNTSYLLVLIMCFIMIAMTRFAYNVFRRNKKANVWLGLMAAFALINGSFVWFLTTKLSVYELPRLSALLFTIIGINLFYTSLKNGKIRKVNIVLGALCMALSVGCKPNFILASIITFIILLHNLKCVAKEKYGDGIGIIRSVFNKYSVGTLVCYMVPYICIGIALMYYNYLRFDSVFEFGAQYQLTIYDVTTYHFDNFAKIPEIIFQNIFSLPTLTGKFPFFDLPVQQTGYLGYQFAINNCGILTLPIFWLIILVPFVLKKKEAPSLDKKMIVSSLIIGAILLYITCVMGAIGFEYTLEWAWLFALPLVYVFYAIDQFMDEKMKAKVIKVIFVMAIATVIITALCMMCHNIEKLDERNTELYYWIRSTLLFWD